LLSLRRRLLCHGAMAALEKEHDGDMIFVEQTKRNRQVMYVVIERSVVLQEWPCVGAESSRPFTCRECISPIISDESIVSISTTCIQYELL
jgi:hypothetical protein